MKCVGVWECGRVRSDAHTPILPYAHTSTCPYTDMRD